LSRASALTNSETKRSFCSKFKEQNKQTVADLTKSSTHLDNNDLSNLPPTLLRPTHTTYYPSSFFIICLPHMFRQLGKSEGYLSKSLPKTPSSNLQFTKPYIQITIQLSKLYYLQE
jgi:hypothetical protein